MFIFFCDRFDVFHWFCVKNLCTKCCCKSLNKQSSGVQERINPFYINSYGENSFGLRTTFRNEFSSWTEVWLYKYTEWPSVLSEPFVTICQIACLSVPRIKTVAHLGVNSQVHIIWGPLWCGERQSDWWRKVWSPKGFECGGCLIQGCVGGQLGRFF